MIRAFRRAIVIACCAIAMIPIPALATTFSTIILGQGYFNGGDSLQVIGLGSDGFAYVPGSGLVRITVNTAEAAETVPYMRNGLDQLGMSFSFNGHKLLREAACRGDADQVSRASGNGCG